MIKKIFIILLFNVAIIFTQSNSVYSRYGIGDLSYSYSARRLGMGSLGVAVDDKEFISVLNPASWSKIRLTRTEIAGKFSGNFITSQGKKNYFSTGTFNGFTLAFPIQKDLGIVTALGLVPYSNIEYNTVNYNNSGNKESFIGEGGISKLFIGTTYHFPFDLSIGASLDYYFGNLKYLSQMEFASASYYSSFFESFLKTKSIGFSLGVISPDLNKSYLNLNDVRDFKIGLTLNFISNLTTQKVLSSSNYSFYSVDTIGQSTTTMKIPTRFIAGISFTYKENYLFYLDYLNQPWSNYLLNNLTNPNLDNSYKLSAGVEFKNSKQGLSFYELFIYRAGISFEKTPYKIYGTNINQFSISGGVSIPLSRENYLDFAVQWGIRGTTNNNLIKENFVNLIVSASLGELWFIRYDK